eukprot:NODE_7657_length_428_cov_0.782842.p5 GENE.NODE_7657_length_428_cov_0.782842~~NODE_7657_length_428_cov_0.782842.p5  ORF type:complete len:52 (-),score=1.73 NODE_7657_length_428_cov_0.782842:140-295(-)
MAAFKLEVVPQPTGFQHTGSSWRRRSQVQPPKHTIDRQVDHGGKMFQGRCW